MSRSAATTILHFIRHADALPDPEAVLDPEHGYDRLPLSVKGVAQADALARRLAATTPLSAIYASPTLRAHETAEAVARLSDLDVQPDPRLREVYLGSPSVSDIPLAERGRAVRDRLAMLAKVALTEGSWASIPDVEPGAEVKARMQAAVEDIVARHPRAQVAIVSHAGSINAYLAQLLGVPRDFFFPIGNASLNSVRVDGERTLLLRLNDIAHLEN
jgi:broad specificity phosphatase PhoE